MIREYYELLLGKNSFFSEKYIRKNLKTEAKPAPLSAILPDLSKPKQSNDTLELIQDELEGCTRCKLSRYRTKIVFGEGNPQAKLMFIGEGPGESEDLQGRPFVGAAGQLLDKIIQAMGLKREDVFIANIVKCRPPGNRAPDLDEAKTCGEFLTRQIECIKPRVIVALGGSAVKYLMNEDIKISRVRGQFLKYKDIDMMATFHPSFLLRNPEAKKDVWDDMKKVIKQISGNP